MLSLLYGPTLTSVHDYWKIIALTVWMFVSKMMCLLFNTLSRLVIAFLPGSKCLNLMAAVTTCSDFGAKENYKEPHYTYVYNPGFLFTPFHTPCMLPILGPWVYTEACTGPRSRLRAFWKKIPDFKVPRASWGQGKVQILQGAYPLNPTESSLGGNWWLPEGQIRAL